MSKTNVEALKALYAQLGGSADVSGINTKAPMIDEITSVASGGGGGGGGGDSGFEVIRTTGVNDMDEGTTTYESIDPDAIPEALEAGKVPVLWVDMTDDYPSMQRSVTHPMVYVFDTVLYNLSIEPPALENYSFNYGAVLVDADGTVTGG